MNLKHVIRTAVFAALIPVGIVMAGTNYTIGVENINYYPQYAYENNEYKGYARELFDLFAKSKGYTFEYKALPIKRLFSEFLTGDVDFKYPDNPYWSADDKKGKNVVYSADVAEYIDGVMVKSSNKGKGLATLKTMGIVMGFTAWDYLDKIKSGVIKLQENSDFTALIKQTLIDRNDGAYCNIDVGNHILAEVVRKNGELVFDPALPHSKDHYKLSSIKHNKVIDEFNDFLKSNKAAIDNLKKKYNIK